MTPKEKALADFKRRLEGYRDDPVGFARDILGVDPHPGQVRWLENATSRENALTAGNRFGKSYASALRLIHRCVYRKGWTEDIARVAANNGQTYEAMNISITAYQARIVWDTVRALLTKPKAAWLIDPGKGKGIVMAPFPTIHFVTGARLQARSTGGSGERLLGVPLDHITWDECAFEKHFKQVRDNVLRMRMVDRAGTIDYVSTGNGRNEYGEYFLSGLPGPRKNPALYSQTGSSFENPTIDRASLEAAVALMPPHMRAQNIDGGIIDGGGGFFSLEDLQAAHDPKLDDMLVVHAIDAEGEVSHAELFFGKKPDDTTGGVRWYDKYPNHKYLHAWDLADKQDYTVGLTYDISTSPWTLVEFERVRRIGWHPIFGRMNARHKRYGSVPRSTKFDATGIGDVVRDDLIALFPDMRAEGVNFAGGRKDEMLTHLQTALSLREVTWPHILPFFNEHAYYERDDKKLKTDCVMANGVFLYFAKRGMRTSWSFGSVTADRPTPSRMDVEPNVLRAPAKKPDEKPEQRPPAVVIVGPG